MGEPLGGVPESLTVHTESFLEDFPIGVGLFRWYC